MGKNSKYHNYTQVINNLIQNTVFIFYNNEIIKEKTNNSFAKYQTNSQSPFLTINLINKEKEKSIIGVIDELYNKGSDNLTINSSLEEIKKYQEEKQELVSKKISKELDNFREMVVGDYLFLILETLKYTFLYKPETIKKFIGRRENKGIIQSILKNSHKIICNSKHYSFKNTEKFFDSFVDDLSKSSSFVETYLEILNSFYNNPKNNIEDIFDNYINLQLKSFQNFEPYLKQVNVYYKYLETIKTNNDIEIINTRNNILKESIDKVVSKLTDKNTDFLISFEPFSNNSKEDLYIKKLKFVIPKLKKLKEYLGENDLNTDIFDITKKYNIKDSDLEKITENFDEINIKTIKKFQENISKCFETELNNTIKLALGVFYSSEMYKLVKKTTIEELPKDAVNESVFNFCLQTNFLEGIKLIKTYISTIKQIREIVLDLDKKLEEKLNYLENEENELKQKFLKKIYNKFMNIIHSKTVYYNKNYDLNTIGTIEINKGDIEAEKENLLKKNEKGYASSLDTINKNLTLEVFITEGLTKSFIEKYITKNNLYFTDEGVKELDNLKKEYDKIVLRLELLKAGYSDNYKSLLKQTNLRLALKGISIFGWNVGISLFEGNRWDAKKALAADKEKDIESKMEELKPIFKKARPSLDLETETGRQLLRSYAIKEIDKDNKLGLWNIARIVNPFSKSSREFGKDKIKSWWSNKVKSTKKAHSISQTFTAFGALASALKNIATLDVKSFTKNIWKATTSIFSAIFLPPENVRQKMREMKDEARRVKKKQKEELKRIKKAKKFLDGSLGKEESSFSDLSITEATKNVFSSTADKLAEFFGNNENSNLSGDEKSGIISSIKNIFGKFSSKAAEQMKNDFSSETNYSKQSNNSEKSGSSDSKSKKGMFSNLKDFLFTSRLSWFATMSSKLFEAGAEAAGGNTKEDKEFKKETLGFGRTIADYFRKFWDSYSKKETRKAPDFKDGWKEGPGFIFKDSEEKTKPAKKEPWWKKLLNMLPFLGSLLLSILGFFGIDGKKVFRFLRLFFKFSWKVIKTSFKILKWIGKYAWKSLKWFFTDGLKKIRWLFGTIAEVGGKIARFLGLDKLLNGIISFFKNPVKSVGDIFGKLLKGSAGFLKSLTNFVIEIVGKTLKIFAEGLVKAGALSTKIVNSALKSLGIKSLDKSILNSELKTSESLLKESAKDVKKIDISKSRDLTTFEKIWEKICNFVKGIGSFLKGAFNLLAKLWSAALDFIKNPSWDSFKQAGKEIISSVKNSFSKSLEYLKETYKEYKGVTTNFIKTCIENAKNTYEAVKTKAAQCWTAFKAVANPKALFSKLMSFVRLLLSPGSVKGAFKAMKAIPLVNVIAAAGFAIYYLAQGKWVAAVCEIIAVLITVFSGGIACAVSIALSLSSEKIQEAYDDWMKKPDDKKVYAVGSENEKNFTSIATEGGEESDSFQDDLNNITPDKILDLFKTTDVNDIQTSDVVLNDIYGSDYSSLSDENIKQKIADKNNFDSSGLNGNSSDSKIDFTSNTIKNITNNTIDYNNINNINASVTNVDFGFDTGDNPYKITKIGNDNAYVFGKPEGSNVAAYSFRKEGVVIENSDGTYEIRTGGTKAWRNNNPGNIRFSKWMWRNTKPIGVDYNGFLIYRTQDEGQRAIGFLLKNSGKYKDKSIPSAIETYAPRNENNTDAYIRHVKRAFFNANLGDVESRTIASLNRMEMDLLVNAIKSKEGNMAGSVKTSSKQNLSSDISSSYNEVVNTYTNKAPSYSSPTLINSSNTNSMKGSVSTTGKPGDILTNKTPQNQVSEENILTTQALIEKQKELVKTISELKADLDLVKKDNQTGDFKLFNSFISWYEM